MKKHKNRYKIIYSLCILTAFLFIIKLFYIQIINDNYKFSANNNVLRYEVQQATRGLIFDRNNKLIVANIPAYDLIIIPRELHNKSLDTVLFCNLLGINKKEYFSRYKKAAEYSKYKESVFIKHLTLENAITLSEKLFQFPGFYLRKLTMRDYPSNSATHLIGYLGEVDNKKTIEDKYYIKGDFSGVTGIEAAYEKVLRGEKGMSIKLVDVHNRDKGVFQNGRFDTLPIAGRDLVSTIDIKLQIYGEKLMKNKIGAIVAIEPSTGEVISLISSPTYNPNLLTGRSRTKSYYNLISDPNKPLFNRALQGTYPPGSIFKLLNGLITMQEGIIKDELYLNCTHGYEYQDNKYVKCHPHICPIEIRKAIEISCNTFFCAGFDRYFNKFSDNNIAYNNWYSHLKSFGIGEYMNNDFVNGKPGRLPNSSYYNNLYKRSWNANTIISMAIGQGELLLTPIQMANITAIIANRGYYYTPHIVKEITGNKIDTNFTTRKYCSIERKHFKPIISGMQNVIEGKNGTAKNARIDSITICGKTGTAQNPHGEDHSIFIAFAPKDNPKIAIAVYVENGGWGSKWAAPIGTLMIEKYLQNKTTNKKQEDFIIKGDLTKK